MKRIFFVSLFMGFYLSCMGIFAAQNDLKIDELKGNVKSMTKTTYTAVEKDGKFEKTGIRYFPFYNEYDREGKRILGKEHDPSGSVIRTWIYKYDAAGNRIHLEIKDFEGNISQSQDYKYDAAGNRIEKSNIDKDGKLIDRWIYKYDDTGNMIEEIYYDNNLKLVKKFVYKYDTNGNKVESFSFKADGTMYSHTIFNYDENNNLKEYITYKDDKPSWRETYKFTKDGKKIEWAGYAAGTNLIWEFKYEYNDKGDLIKTEQQHYKNKSQDNNNVVHYIGKGKDDIKAVSEKEADEFIKSIPEVIKYIYEYDDKGNWIKKISTSGKGTATIIERKIEYYD